MIFKYKSRLKASVVKHETCMKSMHQHSKVAEKFQLHYKLHHNSSTHKAYKMPLRSLDSWWPGTSFLSYKAVLLEPEHGKLGITEGFLDSSCLSAWMAGSPTLWSWSVYSKQQQKKEGCIRGPSNSVCNSLKQLHLFARKQWDIWHHKALCQHLKLYFVPRLIRGKFVKIRTIVTQLSFQIRIGSRQIPLTTLPVAIP